jgi:hypothetical protein
MKYRNLTFLFSFLFLITFGTNSAIGAPSFSSTLNSSVNLTNQHAKTLAQEVPLTTFSMDEMLILDDDHLDDEDACSRKKISSEDNTYFSTKYSLRHLCNPIQSNLYHSSFYHLPDSHFISLRALRL